MKIGNFYRSHTFPFYYSFIKEIGKMFWYFYFCLLFSSGKLTPCSLTSQTSSVHHNTCLFMRFFDTNVCVCVCVCGRHYLCLKVVPIFIWGHFYAYIVRGSYVYIIFCNIDLINAGDVT